MFSFPPVPGYSVVHVHPEGERCVWAGDRPCRYVITLRGRIRRWLQSWLP